MKGMAYFEIYELESAIIVGLIWGFLLLTIFSYRLAKSCCKNVWHVVIEHIGIAVLVTVVAYYVGLWINLTFV